MNYSIRFYDKPLAATIKRGDCKVVQGELLAVKEIPNPKTGKSYFHFLAKIEGEPVWIDQLQVEYDGKFFA